MRTMTSNNSSFLNFNGEEKISDLLLLLPEASEILLSHGLGCFDCFLNQEETLRDGALAHGFSENDLSRILSDLNEAAEDLKIF